MSTETYPRDNWWGDQDNRETVPETHRTGDLEWRSRRRDKAAHVAHLLLRGIAPALCAVTIADPDRTPEELSEPCYYPHGEGNRNHLRALRANERDGGLSGGESTGVVLHGLPVDRFMQLVDDWLDYCVADGVINRDFADNLCRDAERMKCGTDLYDETIVKRLVRDVQAGERESDR